MAVFSTSSMFRDYDSHFSFFKATKHNIMCLVVRLALASTLTFSAFSDLALYK